MQKIILFTVVLFSFVACNLDKLEPAQTKAFMKFFGDVGNTEGVDLLKLDDGYLLLGNSNDTTALLIKTDLNGNTLWSKSFDAILGSALAKNANSYFIVGDSIKKGSPPVTSMSLIKTDLNGEIIHPCASIGEIGAIYHGTSVIISSLGEIVVCGYITSSTPGTDTTFIYGYDESLIPSWTSVKKWWTVGNTRTSSKTILEDSNGDFTWTSRYTVNTVNKLEAIIVSRDNPSITEVIPLLDVLDEELSLADNLGDFSTYNLGGVIVHSVDNINTNRSGIVVAEYANGAEINNFKIEDADYDFFANTVLQASDGDIVILGSTNKHADGSSRSDLDFYITKVGIDASVSSVSGFTSIIGGTGNETGAAIVQADDRGFVFLGTMKNTNEVNIMVLVKVDVNGELIN